MEPEPTDEALVARVVAGEHALFELLMRRHNRRVFRTTRAILKNDDEAEDAMQEAYVSAFTHLADFSGRSRFSTWLVRIAVHECLGRLRKSKRVASFDGEPARNKVKPRSQQSNWSDGPRMICLRFYPA